MNKNCKIFFLLIVLAACINQNAEARIAPPAKRSVNGEIEGAKEPPGFMLILTGGFLAGGKQNTCYLLRSRLMIKKFSVDGSAYYHFNGDVVYNANVAIGNLIQLSLGTEFGDRTYFVNKDSTLEHIKFKNTATGEYEPYSSFPSFHMPQQVTSYNIGLGFGGRFKSKNYWRGVGECWSFVNVKWELMYAPTIGYDKTMDITTQGPYQSQTTTYELEGARVRHFGFRLLVDSRLGSKIGWIMEVGMRPGVRYEINEENRFSNGYVRMGVAFGIALGGRKELDRVGFGREIPKN